METAVCLACSQEWIVMPGDLDSSLDPDCQEKARKARIAAEKAKRKALRGR